MELSRKIINAYKGRGLVTAFIYGKFAHGKTSYLLHTAYEVFKTLFRLKRVDAWLMALDHLFFNPIDGLIFVEAYKREHNQERVVLLGMDDVGQHIPRARWWREDVVQFREWMTVARTDCSAVVFTGPTQLSLPGGIVDACFLRIHVQRDPNNNEQSIASGYEVFVTPYFQQIVSGPKFEDTFPKHYPHFVFEEYEAMRHKAVSPLRSHLIATMGEDETIQKLHKMGATQETIAQVIGKSQPTVSQRLKRSKH